MHFNTGVNIFYLDWPKRLDVYGLLWSRAKLNALKLRMKKSMRVLVN